MRMERAKKCTSVGSGSGIRCSERAFRGSRRRRTCNRQKGDRPWPELEGGETQELKIGGRKEGRKEEAKRDKARPVGQSGMFMYVVMSLCCLSVYGKCESSFQSISSFQQGEKAIEHFLL